MIVVEIPLEDVIIDVEKDLGLGTVSEKEAILHLTQTYGFLPAPLSVTIANGIATISYPAKSRHNRKTKRILERATSEVFSRLQLMYVMYVGFKDINLALDTGMDLAEPYERTLKMREG